jgi:hypothetical protein
MATKQFTRTVEVINTLLDKLALMPDSPANYKGILTNPSHLPEEPSTGDMYLVQYSDTANEHIANYLYYRKATAWEIIATKGYTPYEIDSMLSALAAADIAMTGYEKSSSSDPLPIATTDTASEAIGKLEQQAELNKNNILYNTDNGVKNLFNPSLQSTTGDHYTVIRNSDNIFTFTYDGHTSDRFVTLGTFRASKTSDYLFSQGAEGSTGTAILFIQIGSNYYYAATTGNGTVVPMAADSEYSIVCKLSAYSQGSWTLKPMLRLQGGSDYQPYAPSNRELYEMILALQ